MNVIPSMSITLVTHRPSIFNSLQISRMFFLVMMLVLHISRISFMSLGSLVTRYLDCNRHKYVNAFSSIVCDD